MSFATVCYNNQHSSNMCHNWGSGLPISSKLFAPLNVRNVIKISCGQSHAGIITNERKVYTWGSGEYGMLGHGNKSAINAPKMVMSLAKISVLDVSCGGFHTAFIAADSCDFILHRISSSALNEDLVLCSGQLYTCGQSKAGQLGLSPVGHSTASPRQVQLHAGYEPCKVACGFHHTLVIAVRNKASCLFSFGWGEMGRLGQGDEEPRQVPVLVPLPAEHQPIEVCAGEQHSLSCGAEGSCYSWGSNLHGQLGIGSQPEFAPLPSKVLLPEAMLLRRISVGGHHSAAITVCGRLLTWGWGEDGQLGHGSEKSCPLPRPCRLPRVAGLAGAPQSVSCGMSHTTVLLANDQYVPPEPPEQPLFRPAALPPEPSPEPATSPVTGRQSPPEAFASDQLSVLEAEDIEETPLQEPEQEEQEEEEEPAWNEVQFRVGGRQTKRGVCAEEVEEEAGLQVFTTSGMSQRPVTVRELLRESVSSRESQQRQQEAAEEAVEDQAECQPPSPPSSSRCDTAPHAKQPERTGVYYRDGQSTEHCLVANSARRAEQRRLKKLAAASKGHK